MDRAGWNYPPGDLRVSDADRDRALAELSQACQAGRITADEFDERSALALRSRTGTELIALLADLPAQRRPEPGTAARQPGQRGLATRITVAAVIAAFCFAIAAAGAAISSLGPSAEEQDILRRVAASRGQAIPQFPPTPAFNWAGTITPAAIAVLLVVLVVAVRVRLSRADRH